MNLLRSLGQGRPARRSALTVVGPLFLLYCAFWHSASVLDPVAPGSSSAPLDTAPASEQTAYVLLAPGWEVDLRLWRYYGDSLELEHDHALLGQPGAVRLLAYRNYEVMGRFNEAIAAYRSDHYDTAGTYRAMGRVLFAGDLARS